jgi:uncharacterized protein with FMN-binding domain
MIKLKGSYLAILKALHLLFVASFVGGLIVCLVILGSKTAGEIVIGPDESDIMIYRINSSLVYYSLFGLTITAIIYGLYTHWGILKHRWIIIKWFLLFIVAGIYIATFKPSINGIAALSSGSQNTGEIMNLYHELIRKSIVNNILILSFLVIIFFISTLKPFGRRSSDLLAENRIARVSIISVVILSAGFFVLGWMNLNRLRTMSISSPDLSTIGDGIYNGEFSDGGGVFQVEVEIDNHRISNLDLETDRNSKYVDYARPVITRVIEQQTLNVDAVTGATTTSKCILKAVEEALNNADTINSAN